MIVNSANIKYKAQDLPAPRPSWEQNRTYENYLELLRPSRNYIEFIDFLTMPTTSVILDIGFGEGHFLNYIKHKRPDIETVGVAVSNCKKSLYKNIDFIFIQKIPEDLTILTQYIERIDVITDVFGAATYATNPLHALIYSSFLLKPKGYYFSISSLIPEYENLSCFGDARTRKKIQHFFQEHLGIQLFFEKKEVKSKVELLIYFEKSLIQTRHELSSYNKIIKFANEEIGMPNEINSWKPFTGKFKIISYEYIKYGFCGRTPKSVRSDLIS